MDVEAPVTVVQAEVTVVVNERPSAILREEVLENGDVKVGDLTLLLPEHIQPTDELLITRVGEWSRRVPLQTVLNLATPTFSNEQQYDPALGAGGNTVELSSDYDSAYVGGGSSTVETLNLYMPPVLRHGQTVTVYFARRINNPVFRVSGTDAATEGGPQIPITKSTKGFPAFILPGTTMMFRYNRHTDTGQWDDCQWHVMALSNVEDPVCVTDVVRQYGCVLDGATLNTTKFQQAADAAQALAAPPAGLTYGQGRTLGVQAGVNKRGACDISRSVSVENFAGTLNSYVDRMDYSELLGVVGEDAAYKAKDDGFQQSSLVGTQNFRGIGIDGKYGNEPGHGIYDADGHELNHKRHGVWYTVPADKSPDKTTDHANALYDTHISNMPGSGWKVYGNNQVHGSDFKLLNCEFGIDFDGVSDGKLTNFGLGGNRRGNRANNSASLKQKGVDAWCDSNYKGKPGVDFLWQFTSCSKCTAADGEWEGPVLYTGDNHRSYGAGNDSGPDSKSAFQISQNKTLSINQKTSTDYYIGIGSVRPFAHITIKDGDLEVVNSSWGYKLAATPSQLELDATPRFIFGFDTQMLPSNPNYAQALANCGEVNIVGGNLLWHFPKRDAAGAVTVRPIIACWEHVSNMPWKLRGIVVGKPYLIIGTELADDEVALSGQQLNSKIEPLLYLFTDPAGLRSSTRKLTDGGGNSGGAGINFNLLNLNSTNPVPGCTWVCKRYQ